MKIRHSVAAFLLAVIAGCAPVTLPPAQPAAAAAGAVQELEVAGIPVLFKPTPGNDIVALRVYVRGGSANLRPESAGIEDLLFTSATRGTEKYDKDQFAQLATRIGATFSDSALWDHTTFSAQGIRQHWNELWDLFTQAALHPTFPPAQVEIVRGQIVNSLRQVTDNPDRYLSFLADSVIYIGHAYAIRPEGTVESISALTRDALSAWHRERMAKENLLLVVVGNVRRADVEQKVTAAFGGLPARGSQTVMATPLRELSREALVVNRALPTTYIAGYYAAPAPSDPDYPALIIATRLLHDRLVEEVRTKRNLSYAPGAGLWGRRANIGRIYVSTVSPDSALRVMLDEVRRMQRQPIPVDELGEAVNVILTAWWLANEANMSQAALLGNWEVNGGGWENALRLPDHIRAVTSADVQRVAQKYLRNARFVVLGAGDRVNRSLLGEM